MKRVVYLCKLVGDGTKTNAYRPACSSYACDWRAYSRSESAGTPTYAWAMALICAEDHAPIAADPDCLALDIDFDTPYASVTQDVKDRLVAFLDLYSIPKTFLSSVTVMGEVFVHLGTMLDPNFSRATLNEAGA